MILSVVGDRGTARNELIGWKRRVAVAAQPAAGCRIVWLVAGGVNQSEVDTWQERRAATENAYEGGASLVDNDLGRTTAITQARQMIFR